MKFPSFKSTSIRSLSDQSDEEKMVLLKTVAHQFLGQKWLYFEKIKAAERSGKLFKEKSLFQEMKATQSALKFTSKNTLRQYNLAYQNCIKEIKSFAVTDEVFPELPDESDDNAVKAMIPELDSVIIGWTPLKFLLPAKQIREKGQASERHTEGLITKLFFKVAGFYAVSENWESRKLSFYLDKIDKDSSYQDVALKLEPLKKDLFTFSEEFEQFKFGQAVLSKDTTSDADAFDDAMEVDSFDSQVLTLYWHRFIYKAIESFLLRYYLTLISSTVSIHAVRYLSTVFEPALTHAIDMSVLFDGSFDTDASKKRFRNAFVEFQKTKAHEEPIKKIKIKQGEFDVYNYNLPLVIRHGVPFEINKDSGKTSFWWLFTEKAILGKNRADLEKELSFTPFQKIAGSIADFDQQNKDLAREKVKLTAELADLKEGIKDLKQEMVSLDTTYKNENPLKIKEQLKLRNNYVEKGLQESENQLKKLREEGNSLIQKEKELAQERDQLLEEEENLEKIGELELRILDQKKQSKQIQEEEVALEERDVRYTESKKKIDLALKNSEKNQEKDAKTIEGIVTRIADNEAAKAALQKEQQKVLEETRQKLVDLSSVETRSTVLIHILALLIASSQKRKEAWQKVLERFKQRLISDQKLAQSRVEEIKKESQKKLREMGKKASKLERLKQDAAVKDFEKEMETYQQGVDQKCRQIIKFAKQDAVQQKQRITQMFQKISKDKKRNNALPARRIFDMICQMEDGEQFKNEFLDFLIQSTAQTYQQKLEPLYRNMFRIFNPTLLKKVSLAQALKKSGEANGIRLELSDEEQKSFDGIIQGVKNSLRKQKPDIFDYQVMISAANVTIVELLDIKIDNPSLLNILSAKFSTPKNPKAAPLHPALIKKLLELNQITFPVAENNLVLEGKEKERDPINRINTSLLKKLISEIEPAQQVEI